MFGYVIPPVQMLPQEEQDRFRHLYCGLCRTLRERYGLPGELILNYDFTVLAMLLSDGEELPCGESRCIASPIRPKTYCRTSEAMALAADESVILTYWQLKDEIVDHGFRKGLKYRGAARALQRAYEKAAALRPEFDRSTQQHLQRLAELEAEKSPSLDAAADAFAQLLAGAAEEVKEEQRRRILRQMLYHLGRWIYLVDAADDLKEDIRSGSYNPLRYRYSLQGDTLTGVMQKEFASTLDHSIHMIATALELADFGCWTAILEVTVYQGLFRVGKAVLDGTFQKSRRKRDRKRVRKPHE